MSITLTQVTGMVGVDVLDPNSALVPPSIAGGTAALAAIDDYGAAGDGITDDSAALRAAAATGRWVELGARTYRVDQNVLGEIAGRVLLRGVPGASVIRLGALPAGDWMRIATADVWIDGVIFDANAALTGGTGWPFFITGQQRAVSIRRSAFLNAGWGFGRGLVIAADAALPATLSVELDEVRASGAANDGIWIEHGARGVLRRLDCSGNGDAGLRIQRFDNRLGVPSRGIVIEGGRFADNAGDGITAGIYTVAGTSARVYGPDDPDAIDVRVEGAVATGNGGYGVYLAGDRVGMARVRASANGPLGALTLHARHGWVQDCQVHDQVGIAIDVGGSREVDVSRNEMWACGNGLALGAERVTGSGNRFWACTGALISVFDPESANATDGFPVRVQAVTLRDTAIDITAVVPTRAIQIQDNAPVVLDGLHVLSTDGARGPAHAIRARSARCVVRRGLFNLSPIIDLEPDGGGVLTVPDMASVVRVASTTAITAIRTQSQADLAGGIAWASAGAQGSGYTAAAAAVAGDGSGAILAPLLWDGRVIGARVNANGTGYTAATASVTGTGTGAALTLQVGVPLPDGIELTVLRPAGGDVLGRAVPAGGLLPLLSANNAWVLPSAGSGAVTGAAVIAALGFTPVSAAQAAAAAPVQSVAGRTGAVVLGTSDVGGFTAAAAAASPVQSVAGRTGAVVLGTSDVAGFTAAAAAASPVQSVAGRTGAVAVDYGMTVSWGLGAVPVPGTIVLDGRLSGSTTILAADHSVGSTGGSVTFRLQLVSGGTTTAITGLSSVTSNAAGVTTTAATGANVGGAADRLELVILSVTGSPTDTHITVRGTKP